MTLQPIPYYEDQMWENDRAQYAAEMITCAVFISGRILRQMKTIYEGEKVPHIDAKRAREETADGRARSLSSYANCSSLWFNLMRQFFAISVSKNGFSVPYLMPVPDI